MNNSDIEAVVAKLKSAPVGKRLGERFYISEELFRIAVNNQAKEKEVKKYRLKKDTPTIKAGTIFQEVTSDYDKSRELVRIMPLGSATSPQWTIDDINEFDEWFEEVKEFEEWKPMDGEQYLRVDPLGKVRIDTWRGADYECHALSVGNCYPLDTPDETIIKEQKLIPQAMHRLKMAAKKAWFEFDGSERPDWVGDERSCWPARYRQEKYYLAYDYLKNTIVCDYTNIWQHIGGVYFPTKESAQAYIDNNEDDLKLLFGVE